MIKHFCDLCGAAALNPDPQREFRTFVTTERSGSEVHVRILRSINGGWNAGCICDDCLALALSACQRDLERETPPDDQPLPEAGNR